MYHDWSTENNTIISLKLQFNRKIYNHFLKYRCTYQNYLGGFWKIQVPRYCLFSPKFQMCFWWGAMFKNNCTIWLYDNLLLLSSLFHFISYSVLPFHSVYVFQFVSLLLFFLKHLSSVVEKLLYTYRGYTIYIIENNRYGISIYFFCKTYESLPN